MAHPNTMPLPKVKTPVKPPEGESGQQDLERPTAIQIYDQVLRNARHELDRSNVALAISGFVGGLVMGLTGLSVSSVTVMLGHGAAQQFVEYLFYPMGFMAVILGRGQLFTENTLYPVALVLAEHRYLWSTLRLWVIVFVANVFGVLLFATLCAKTSALQPANLSALAQLGSNAAAPSGTHIFWSAVVGGWIIALVAWMVSGSHSITGSFALVWSLAFIVGIGHFAHCIATSGEILTSVLCGNVTALRYLQWLGLTTAGNIGGGVVLVTLLEYGQAKLE